MPDPKHAQAANGEPLVSVVVLTRDRPELLLRCVRSVSASTYDRWEMVIVDNGSAASRESITEGLRAIPHCERIRHVVSPPRSLGLLRQMAADHARGEILFSIDDDCETAPDAMARVVARFAADPTIGVVGGQIENIGFEGIERFKGRGRFTVNGMYEPCEDPADAEVFGGANASIRRSALEQAGGYDPFFRAALEDADVVLAIRRSGFRIVYDPGVRVTHRHTPARFRSPWRNVNLARLYLFFKHFRPRGAAAWLRFAADELRLLVRDVATQIRALAQGSPGPLRARDYPKWALKMLVLRGIELGKAVGARLAIPYLIWRARPRITRSSLCTGS